MAELITRGVRRAAMKEQVLRLAMESFGDALQMTRTDVLLARAREIEGYLYTPERPHHACREPECATPSGKIACHTCGEAWPCSTELRKRGES